MCVHRDEMRRIKTIPLIFEGDSLLLVCLFTWEILRRFHFKLTSSGEPVIETALHIASSFCAVPSEGLSGFLSLAICRHAFSLMYLAKSSAVSR